MIELVDFGVVQVFNDETQLYRHIYPCTKTGGEWQDTDISEESAEVQEFCAKQWTDEVKQAYKDHIDANLVEE